MTPRKKIIIAIGLFVGVSVLFIVMAFIFSKVNEATTNQQQGQDTATSYIDSDSGEEVITSGKVPETVEDGPLILGTSKFLTYGLSTLQYQYMMNSINDYIETTSVNGKEIKKFSVVVASVRQILHYSGDQDAFLTDIKLNDSITYFMVVTFNSTFGDDMVVNIYDKEGGTLLYTTPPKEQLGD